MAHKSKSQRNKAAIAKQNKKDRQLRDEAAAGNSAAAVESTVEDKKSGLLKKKEDKSITKAQPTSVAKKEAKPKKVRFQFLQDVRAEMKRVTWPTRNDVVRWTGVVVGALIFFGVYVAILDNLIVSPGIVALAGLGA